MTDKDLAEAVEFHLKQTKISFPDWQKRLAAGAYSDVRVTHWWQALNFLGQIGVDTPVEWTCAEPGSTGKSVTTVSNLNGLGINVNNQTGAAYTDTLINGTGDSGILLQGTTTKCDFQRIRMLNVASVSAVSWAKHAIYCKARGNTFSDIYAENGGNAASGLSVRMGNNTFLRTVLKRFNFPVTYYEHDGSPGTVSFIDGEWTFGGDTAVWGDDSNEPPMPYIKQGFVFENIKASGPGAFFLKFGNSYGGSGPSYRGAGVTIKGCTLNGNAVTPAMVFGVPSGLLAIS